MNFFKADVKGQQGKDIELTLPGGKTATIASRSGAVPSGGVEIGVRPEHVKLGPAGNGSAFDGKVRIVEQLGNTTLVYVDTPAGELIIEGEGNLAVAPDEAVGVSIDARSAHLFGANEQVV